MSAIPRPPGIDPILASVLQRRLRSITEEMALTLLHTTRSPILSEGRDFATGVYWANGDMLEQTEYTALLGFALQPSLKACIEYFKDDIRPGDVIFHNDVYLGGNQINDLGVFKPIFFEDELVAWAACKAHQADLGGGAPGGYNPEATEIWHEGLRVPPLKMWEAGKLRRDVWDMIFANTRLDIVAEDAKACAGSCNVGERRVLEVLGRYGREAFDRHMAYIMDGAERIMRGEIAAMPDGVYRGESFLANDGFQEGVRHKVVCTLTVDGDAIAFDYTGSAGPTPGYANAPLHASTSGLMIAILMNVDPEIPHNAGMLRPIEMIFPENSMLNAEFPHATSYGNHLTHQIWEAAVKALAQAIPHRVTAGWNKVYWGMSSGYDRRSGRRFVDFCLFAMKGGSGATEGLDGLDHIGTVMTGGAMTAQDPEMHEIQTPHRIRHFEYEIDSAGPGRWRGGLGIRSEWQLLGRDAKIIMFGQQTEPGEEPFGLFGGRAAGLNTAKLTYPGGREYISKGHEIIPDAEGVVIEQVASGGGGYGDPRLRPAEIVREEVRDEIVSAESARRDYGVALDPETLEIDEAETARLRKGV
ncbi:MAG TPA: hydantoin utilization protein B [Nitrospinae bacterium]|nr:hydantoin utilization protein B [Nitrospinota bacterium]